MPGRVCRCRKEHACFRLFARLFLRKLSTYAHATKSELRIELKTSVTGSAPCNEMQQVVSNLTGGIVVDDAEAWERIESVKEQIIEKKGRFLISIWFLV